MKQNFLTLVILSIAIFTTFKAQAYDFECNGLCYNILNDYSVEVTYKEYPSYVFYVATESDGFNMISSDENDGDSEIESIIVPAVVENNGKSYNVVGIGENAFAGKKENYGVVLPESLSYIDDNAFYWSGLQEISLPESLIRIGDAAFQRTLLHSIKVSDSVASLGDWCFSNCADLSSVNFGIDSKLEYLGDNCFAECYKLENIELYSKVRNIGKGSFYNCKMLKEFKCSGPVNIVDNDCFYNCDSLKVCEVLAQKWGTNVFNGCINLDSITLCTNVIGNGCFANSGIILIRLLDLVAPVNIKDAFNDEWTAKFVMIEVSDNQLVWMDINYEDFFEGKVIFSMESDIYDSFLIGMCDRSNPADHLYDRCEPKSYFSVATDRKLIMNRGMILSVGWKNIQDKSLDILFDRRVVDKSDLSVDDLQGDEVVYYRTPSLLADASIYVGAEGTGVETVERGDDNTGYNVYDMTGKVVLTDVKELENVYLPKGLYLVKGKDRVEKIMR